METKRDSLSVVHPGYFTASLAEMDPQVGGAIQSELLRQQGQVELIASENIVSRAVLMAQGSIITNKTVEGYPGHRYHGGAEFVDIIERLAIERAKQLFGCDYANVQAHSGSQANQTVFVALLRPGDPILSMALNAGGHLSHGAPPNMSGKWFDVVHYGVDRESGLIDYDEVERLAERHHPKLIIAGGSAYPRAIDFAQLRVIADKVGAHLLVDMAHFAALVVAGVHPDPMPYADIVTTTTTKTLRGARGGLILTNDRALARKIDSALFPGLQGSVHLHIVTAKAVCLGEALRPEFRAYGERVLANARALSSTLLELGFDLATGGTDTPLILVDVSSRHLTGEIAERALEAAGLTCNKNPFPLNDKHPSKWSGIRLGASACTTRGFNTDEFCMVGRLIGDVLDDVVVNPGGSEAVRRAVLSQVKALCSRFPIYPELEDV